MLTTSPRCREAFFHEPWFQHRRQELQLSTALHRKTWEFVLAAQVYLDQIGAGGHVLGFGVGQEPLPAWFASRSATVLATDQAPEGAGAWAETAQYSGSVEGLRRPDICPETRFDDQVRFRAVDMTVIPEDLCQGEYDLVWSSCSLEHLGSLDAGLHFMLRSMQALRPGGVAVHTTELCADQKLTMSHGSTVLYREMDLRRLEALLARQGDRLWSLDLAPGDTEADRTIDLPPYHDEPHLNLRIGTFVSTSVALIITRGGA